MDITRHFEETIQARALRDPEFRAGLLKESIVKGSKGVKSLLDYIRKNIISDAISVNGLKNLSGQFLQPPTLDHP